MNILNGKLKGRHIMASEGTSQIVGERIKQARLYREMTQEDLADLLGIKKQTISKYEKGDITISTDIIFKLRNALKFPVKFFYTPYTNSEKKESIIYFRTKNIPKKTQAHLEQTIRLLDEQIMPFYLQYIDFPKPDIPDLSKYISYGTCGYKKEDIKVVAQKLREYWNLGEKPIGNLAYLLQTKGFILIKKEISQNKTDGFSKWINNIPYIITSSNKDSAVRSRFDHAHELGHLILHNGVGEEEQGSKHIEQDADYFASEFLYPSDVFIEEIKELPLSMETFIRLKEKWKISIQALIRKCLDLHLISEEKYTYFQKRISFKGWRTREPLDNVLVIEKPRILRDAAELLLEHNKITKQQIADEIPLDKDDIIDLCNLPKDFFSENLSKIIKIY
ncbi:helix-turn-helix domain-containing protein [Thermotalea metallivorans]|uniref:HTH cro/C1-type domain-containing protein n=1 Tax=Thermotalea metallivorans TaxID=520762 RepID=A0A140KZV0_9FIRM|nr:XRE family transcriptional regulator [Thermotalea metallivorans]KXG73825.1 hypothetical protein AN619_28590 [Thermotalea metallivorans]